MVTRRWHGFSDELPLTASQVAQTEEEYRDYIRELARRLPPSLRRLAGLTPDPVVLHDARVARWHDGRPRSLTLEIVWHDQRRDRQASIVYRGAVELVGSDGDRLAVWLGDPETELLYDEIDAVADGRWEHRHLLWPAGEFAVRFAELDLVSD